MGQIIVLQLWIIYREVVSPSSLAECDIITDRLSSSHNLCMSDLLTFAPTQMPTSMEGMGKHELRRMQNVI